MRDSSDTDLAATAEWGASDALLLEGLSGLDQRFAKLEASQIEKSIARELDEPYEGRVPVAGMTGFRSARELRAAQERVAALERSAVRRRDGVTQALGLSEAPISMQPEHQPTRAPRMNQEPAAATSTNGGVGSERTSLREFSKTPAVVAPPVSEVKLALDQEVPTQDVPQQPVVSRRSNAASKRERVTLEPRPVRDLGSKPEVEAAEVEGRHLKPQMEPIVRRRRTSSSFLPSVLTSFLLTTLVWGTVLFTAWKFVGEEWFANRVQEAASREGTAGSQLQLSLQTLRQDVRSLEDTLTHFRTGHQRFVRMNALEASLYAHNSRQKYDELKGIGEQLETGSPEEEFYRRTKVRIEQAYIKRIAQYPGLNTAKYFPELGQRSDKRVDKEALTRFINDQSHPGWDRARAAYLLRRYEDSDSTVVEQLRQTVRDDEDLQVYFAAWDSLVEITGYEPGAKGDSPADFDLWWSRRS